MGKGKRAGVRVGVRVTIRWSEEEWTRALGAISSSPCRRLWHCFLQVFHPRFSIGHTLRSSSRLIPSASHLELSPSFATSLPRCPSINRQTSPAPIPSQHESCPGHPTTSLHTTTKHMTYISRPLRRRNKRHRPLPLKPIPITLATSSQPRSRPRPCCTADVAECVGVRGILSYTLATCHTPPSRARGVFTMERKLCAGQMTKRIKDIIYLHRTRRPPQHIPLRLRLRLLLIHRIPAPIFVIVCWEEQAIWVFVAVVFRIDRRHAHAPLRTRRVLITAQACAPVGIEARSGYAGRRHYR